MDQRFPIIPNIYGVLLRANKRFRTNCPLTDKMSRLITLIRAEQLRALGRNGPVGALSALAAAFVLAGVIYLGGPQNRSSLLSVAWLAVMTAEVAWHSSLCYRYRRARSGETRRDRWEPRFVLIALLEGLEPPERAIVELSLQGYSAREISTQLVRAERTVQRVREHVRTQLQRWNDEIVA